MSENGDLKSDRAETDRPPMLGRMYPAMTKEEGMKLMRSAMEIFYQTEGKRPSPQTHSEEEEEETRGDSRQLLFKFKG